MKLSRTNGRGLDLFQQLTRGRRLGIGSPQSLEIAIFDGARTFACETLPSLSRPHAIPVTLAGRPHPFPSRTRKLSSPAPKILRGQPFGKIGRRQDFCVSAVTNRGLLVCARRPLAGSGGGLCLQRDGHIRERLGVD